MDEFSFILYLFSTFGVFTVIFVGAIIYLFVLYPAKGEKLVGLLARLVAWSGKRAEKTATAMSIQGRVNSFIATINTEIDDLLPCSLQIKWVSPELNQEAFIEKDRVVVMLSYHNNQDENLSKATLLYMNKAVIPEARPHIDNKLGRAIDLMMTKKALYSFIEARSSLNYFFNSILRPEAEKDRDLKEFCHVIDSTDERGLFTRVLLRELLELGRRRAGITENGDTVFESGEFVKFLDQIAKKERGEDVPLAFQSRYIKVAIILVARLETAGAYGIEPYIKRIKEKIKQSVNVIYIFARGKSSCNFAKVVSKHAENIPEITKVHEEDFPMKRSDGKVTDAYCSIFYNRKKV